jgi:hypothetical protein
VLIPLIQDNKEKDIEAINADMLHGPVDELYVLSEAMYGPHTLIIDVPLSGLCARRKEVVRRKKARRKKGTPSRTSCALERSSGHPQDLSPLCRCSAGSLQSSRSTTTKLSMSGRALTYFMRSAYTDLKRPVLLIVVLLQVCLDDLIDLYRLVFARILSREFAKGSPYTRYYIGTSTPLVWKDIATSFGKTLKQMGKIATAEPRSINVTDLSKSDPTVTKLDPTKLDPSKPATKPDPTK